MSFDTAAPGLSAQQESSPCEWRKGAVSLPGRSKHVRSMSNILEMCYKPHLWNGKRLRVMVSSVSPINTFCRGAAMYESDAIVMYLYQTYGGGAVPPSYLLPSTLVSGWMPTIIRAGRGELVFPYFQSVHPYFFRCHLSCGFII
jgi:hypothetical protein